MEKLTQLPLAKTNQLFPIISQTLVKEKGLKRTNLYVPIAWIKKTSLSDETLSFLNNIDPEFFKPKYCYYQDPNQYIQTPPIFGYVINGLVMGKTVELMLVKLVGIWRGGADNQPYINTSPNWAHECVMIYEIIEEITAATQAIFLVSGGVGVGLPHPIDVWLSHGLVDIELIHSQSK